LASNIEKSNLNIIVSGYGCCRSEILATRGPLYDIQRFGINFVNMAEDADILVLSGFSSKSGINNAINIYKRMRSMGICLWKLCNKRRKILRSPAADGKA